MKKYIVTYHAPINALKQMEKATPEEAKEGMKVWQEWAEKCGQNLIDIGTPLAKGRCITVDKNVNTSERKLCGYSILQAQDIDQALELVKDHPHIAGWDEDCEIEVHEAIPMMN